MNQLTRDAPLLFASTSKVICACKNNVDNGRWNGMGLEGDLVM